MTLPKHQFAGVPVDPSDALLYNNTSSPGHMTILGGESMDGLTPEPDFVQQAMLAAARNIAARLDSRYDGLPYFLLKPREIPPKAYHNYCDYADMTGRYVEALIHVRRITGETFPKIEEQLRWLLLSLFDKGDGLAWCPPTEWCDHMVDLFGQSCAMHGLVAWFAESGSERVREIIGRMIAGMRAIGVEDRGAISWPEQFYYPGGWKGRPGRLAGYNGRLALPLMEYHRLTGDEAALRLAEAIGVHVIERSGEVDLDGRILAHGLEGHLHSWMDAAAGLVAAARVLHRPEWARWADRLFRWVLTQSTAFGWVPDSVGSGTCETCTIMSAIRLALELICDGHTQYWNVIERFGRNHLLQSQFRQVGWLPEPEKLEEGPGWTTRGIPEMILGSFDSWSNPNSLLEGPDIEGCCTGGGVQALAMLWDVAVIEQDGRAQINLPFSRQTSWGRITSRRDREGEIIVSTQMPLRSLAVRIPDWVDKQRVSVDACGAVTEGKRCHWEGDFLTIASARAGDRIVIRYPLREFDEEIEVAGRPYHVSWRGDTVRRMSPPGEDYPLYTAGG